VKKADYERYLESEEWQAKRRQVFARCKGVCEGCLRRAARQVHHLTYDRVGNELLEDLLGVCRGCHETFHGKTLDAKHLLSLSPKPKRRRNRKAAAIRAAKIAEKQRRRGTAWKAS
jgi:5-methylcytosine-specific restriction endonuclease McrA